MDEGVVVGLRLVAVPERPTMADVRLDRGPGRLGTIPCEDCGFVDEVGWEGGFCVPLLDLLVGVVLLDVVSILYIRTPPSRQAVAKRSKPRTLNGAH